MQQISNTEPKHISLISAKGYDLGGASVGRHRMGRLVLAGLGLLVLGALCGWKVGSTGGQPAQATAAQVDVQGQLLAQKQAAFDEFRRTRLAKADVESFTAELSQSQAALEGAKSALATAMAEYDAAVASATARNDMAQKTFIRQQDLYRRSASTQDELDNALMAAKVTQADLATARSKRLCIETLKAAVAQRGADIRVNQAKLNVAMAELEFAQHPATQISDTHK